MTYSVYLQGLVVMIVLATITWIISIVKRDVSIVDSIWSLMILAGGVIYVVTAEMLSNRNLLIISLLLIWALRLSVYLTWRNWGEPEDRRYQQIRKNNSPHFAFKSLGIIFILQAVLAWFISLPLWPVMSSSTSFMLVDILAISLWLTGMFFESVGDWQLARFKSDPANHGKVMDQGLWRYTRHPNYFGEALIWWGFYLFAVGSGAWWTLPAPLLMNWLLLKFSGVVMLEETITERRPAYKQYIEATNAFIPGPPGKQTAQFVNGGRSS
ncbi:MAG: DUF1295 domain-containing protein [Gammaproteobacteria bacterium]